MGELKDNISSLEALQLALKKEQEAHGFYKEASEKVEDKGAKKMFALLAEEELRHIDIIQDELDKGFYREM